MMIQTLNGVPIYFPEAGRIERIPEETTPRVSISFSEGQDVTEMMNYFKKMINACYGIVEGDKHSWKDIMEKDLEV
jgi:hypothetical protein